MNFAESLKLRVVPAIQIIWWHTTGLSVSSNMEGINQKLHPPIELLGKVGTLPFQITRKGMQITCLVIPKVVQSINVLSMTKGHDEKQVHLRG